MSKKDVFKYYKSGIERISAKSNPFADTAEESGGTESDDAVRPAAHIKSNLWMIIAAALALCIAVGTFVVVSKTAKVEPTHESGREKQYSQTTTTISQVTSSAQSRIDSNIFEVTSSQHEETSSRVTEIKEDFLQQAIYDYSDAEDNIQELFSKIKALSSDYETNKDKIDDLASTLQMYYQMQQNSVSKLIFFKHQLPDIVVLDTRFVEGSNPETIRATILNLDETTAVISGVAKLNISDNEYAYCVMSEQKSIEYQTCRYTAWYSSLENESGINMKNKILNGKESKKVGAVVQVTRNGKTSEIKCEVNFKSKNAFDEQEEKNILGIIKKDLQNSFDKVDVISSNV